MGMDHDGSQLMSVHSFPPSVVASSILLLCSVSCVPEPGTSLIKFLQRTTSNPMCGSAKNRYLTSSDVGGKRIFLHLMGTITAAATNYPSATSSFLCFLASAGLTCSRWCLRALQLIVFWLAKSIKIPSSGSSSHELEIASSAVSWTCLLFVVFKEKKKVPDSLPS